ncbi:hypothetical protein [uncultured Caulobacter sp.]|uniref:hypothetical protein n=1 Tax=uncultured Caulobacter sp. TaxID=158749 RepID=UPI0026057403|nr:hypothetical protein [uncultured Caulobacter sp.]
MQGLKIDEWWHGLIVAGVAVLGVGAFAKDTAVIGLAFGMVFFGVGVWANHAKSHRLLQPTFDTRFLASSQEFRPTWFGMIASIIGAGLIALGGFKLVLKMLA